MTPLEIRSRNVGASRRWENFGFLENPFPTSGVESSVHYSEYQEASIAQVSDWLSDALQREAHQWAPLVIKGSIGVGKTHILHQIERTVADLDDSEVEVTRHTLTGGGARSLALSELLIEGLTSIEERFEERTGQQVISALVATETFEDALRRLPSASPLRLPLLRVSQADGREQTELADILFRWICRVPLRRPDYARLGVSGKIDGEGQSVRTIAHLFRVFRETKVLDIWLVLIDQLEDLFRKEATTPMKRARFLTDLRTLVDEGLEGAPIPLVLAWNTAISGMDVSEQIRQQYVALFSRLAHVVDLPALPRENALAFATAYMESGYIEFDAKAGANQKRRAQPKAFRQALGQNMERIVEEIAEPGGDVMPRQLLSALRAWADAFVDGTGERK